MGPQRQPHMRGAHRALQPINVGISLLVAPVVAVQQSGSRIARLAFATALVSLLGAVLNVFTPVVQDSPMPRVIVCHVETHPEADGLRLLTPASLARRLHVPERWILQEAEQGRLPYVRLGGRVRFRPGDVRTWLSTRTQPRMAPRDDSAGCRS
jgi:excisionase family DNA binding protein